MKYTVYSDGASRGNPGPAGAGFIIYDESGGEVYKNSIPLGSTTNNIAEYTALLEAIKYVSTLKPVHVDFCLDSELIVKQVSGIYKVKTAHLIPYYEKIMTALMRLSYTCSHVRREFNKEADRLANLGADISESRS